MFRARSAGHDQPLRLDEESPDEPPARCRSCGQPVGYWTTDWLTGLLDRRGWQTTAPDVVAETVHAGAPLALLIVDVDRFKHTNDTAGHTAGDMLLRAIGAVLRAVTTERDVLGRYGGDEFVLLLPATDLAGALRVASRIHQHVQRLTVRIPLPGKAALSVVGGHSVSVGLAVHQPGRGTISTLDELFLAADAALLAAKRNGRGRTYSAPPEAEPEAARVLDFTRPRPPSDAADQGQATLTSASPPRRS